jgi:3-methylfumaryl-CoA hydratase
MNEIIERTEMLLPEPAYALAGLLDLRAPDLAGGAGLPLLWHWVYLLDRPAQADLGPDGAPVRGTVSSFPGLGRGRMWVGGQVRARGPLRCGEPATKRSRLLSVRPKQGRSGPLTFIHVVHEITQHDRVVIEERQDLVYGTAASLTGQRLSATEVSVARPANGERVIDISPTLLFRFSALTYNAHRIHYDRDYAREVEGYPGLLVHGPLQALVMAEAARAAGISSRCEGDLCFEYRLTSPLFDHQGMMVSAAREPGVTATAVRDSCGRQTAAGRLRARFRDDTPRDTG